jgi:hypothetical protein
MDFNGEEDVGYFRVLKIYIDNKTPVNVVGIGSRSCKQLNAGDLKNGRGVGGLQDGNVR